MKKTLGYYPYGAIPRADLLKVGDVVFRVLGLGRSSFLEILHIKRFENNGMSIFVHGVDEKNRQDQFSLVDSNVDRLNNYNSHFIFHDRDLAEDYLAWAKVNTAMPERSDY